MTDYRNSIQQQHSKKGGGRKLEEPCDLQPKKVTLETYSGFEQNKINKVQQH